MTNKDGDKKAKIAAIVIGFLMIFSILGFAISSISITPQQGPGIQIPSVVHEELTPQERSYVLQTGRVIIENIYYPGCEECMKNGLIFEGLANELSDFIVTENVQISNENETGVGYKKFQIIGFSGQIKELYEEEINPDNMFAIFCELAIAKPKECILLEI